MRDVCSDRSAEEDLDSCQDRGGDEGENQGIDNRLDIISLDLYYMEESGTYQSFRAGRFRRLFLFPWLGFLNRLRGCSNCWEADDRIGYLNDCQGK